MELNNDSSVCLQDHLKKNSLRLVMKSTFSKPVGIVDETWEDPFYLALLTNWILLHADKKEALNNCLQRPCLFIVGLHTVWCQQSVFLLTSHNNFYIIYEPISLWSHVQELLFGWSYFCIEIIQNFQHVDLIYCTIITTNN